MAAVVPVLRRIGVGPSGPARIVALGCGGAGCHVLRRLRPGENLVPVALNDALHPAMAGIPRRVLLDREPLRALAEADPAVAKETAAPVDSVIAGAIEGSHIAAIFAGLGGDTGGWASAVAARVARDHGVPTIALVATPFASEGLLRRRLAEEQGAALCRAADAVVAFANDALLRIAPKLPLARAFGALGAIMVRPAEELARVARVDDIAPLREVFRSAGVWRYGAGEGRDRHAAFLAVEEAVASPWFERPPEEAIAGVAVLTLAPGASSDETVRELRKRVPRASLLVGVAEDPVLAGRIQVSLLAGWP